MDVQWIAAPGSLLIIPHCRFAVTMMKVMKMTVVAEVSPGVVHLQSCGW